MTLLQEREVQHTLPIRTTAISGSRRRNGNTKFLLEKANLAAEAYVNEINSALIRRGLGLRLQFKSTIFETHFEDHDQMLNSIRTSEALLLASPVYFGSISPTLNSLMQKVSEDPMTDLTTKSAGSIAVGTQRNGGQETAIEDLWRWYLDRNISFVGNGPVTSQYGGTAWGGARMSARRDVYGISTTEGAGKTLVQDALLRSTGKTLTNALDGGRTGGSNEPVLATNASEYVTPCRFLFFSDQALPDGNVLEMMKGIEDASKEFERDSGLGSKVAATIDFLSLEDQVTNVKDCAACAICPPGNKKIPGVYSCIYNDDLNKNFSRFFEASAIICSTHDKFGLTPPDYWKVLNRMRPVRRNDYMFTGKVGSVVYKSSPGSQIALKWLIRNNMTILSSSRENHYEFGKLLFRETNYRVLGQKFFKENGVNIWTPPTHHE
jgi:multimeric flavodoxin WrbA